MPLKLMIEEPCVHSPEYTFTIEQTRADVWGEKTAKETPIHLRISDEYTVDSGMHVFLSQERFECMTKAMPDLIKHFNEILLTKAITE